MQCRKRRGLFSALLCGKAYSWYFIVTTKWNNESVKSILNLRNVLIGHPLVSPDTVGQGTCMALYFVKDERDFV
jgi:hypothetical protein